MNSEKPAGPTLSASASVSPIVSIPERSWVERIKRYFAAADLDEAEEAGTATITRLPDPLPASVNAVATGQLILNGLTVAASAAALVVGGLAVIGSPFYFGRVGVGYSMFGLFGLSVIAVVSAIPFFAARGASRILRRDPRGIRPVYRWATIAALMSLFALVGVASIPFFGTTTGDSSQTFSIVRGLFSAASSLAFHVWTVVVLRKYKKEVAAEIAANEH